MRAIKSSLEWMIFLPKLSGRAELASFCWHCMFTSFDFCVSTSTRSQDTTLYALYARGGSDVLCNTSYYYYTIGHALAPRIKFTVAGGWSCYEVQCSDTSRYTLDLEAWMLHNRLKSSFVSPPPPPVPVHSQPLAASRSHNNIRVHLHNPGIQPLWHFLRFP